MKKIIIANWKMNPSSEKEAEILFKKIVNNKISNKNEVVICPPFLYISQLRKISKKISLGAQNVFFVDRGAFTGEISAVMLKNQGVKYVIVGHSERRNLGEKNIEINKKIKAVLSAGLYPVLCVGEQHRDESHEYFNIVKKQIEECLDGFKKNQLLQIIIAYEPVWALSTTKDKKQAEPADSLEMVIFIKKILADKFMIRKNTPKILYGGSVDDKNINDFLINGGVDGVLVGGASLSAEKFLKIISH